MNEKPSREGQSQTGFAVAPGSVGSRQARRIVAEQRRKGWRLRWIAIGRAEIANGRTMHDAIVTLGHDAERLCKAQPALKSEIIRAFEEWTTALCAAVLKVREEDSPNEERTAHERLQLQP